MPLSQSQSQYKSHPQFPEVCASQDSHESRCKMPRRTTFTPGQYLRANDGYDSNEQLPTQTLDFSAKTSFVSSTSDVSQAASDIPTLSSITSITSTAFTLPRVLCHQLPSQLSPISCFVQRSNQNGNLEPKPLRENPTAGLRFCLAKPLPSASVSRENPLNLPYQGSFRISICYERFPRSVTLAMNHYALVILSSRIALCLRLHTSLDQSSLHS